MIYNDTSLSLDIIIKQTFELAWNYTNWMGPVKVPSPI
ncbi:hypothetical protein KBD45_08575 [Candidatus Dojkabacteria bacterium]|nr:hypothetical protein [Candidatus Dojkabacteria bacterium]